MKNIFVFLGGAIIGLILGFALYKSQEVIKYVDKEIKVYDLSQEPKMIQYYAGMVGMVLLDSGDIEELEKAKTKAQMEKWNDGYSEGYRDGKSK